MDKHDHHGGSGFFNGFLLGAIIGAAVVFFLFTDKGKKLLRTIMEEGSEGFQQLQGILDEEMEEEDEVYDEMAEETMPEIPHKKESSHHIEPIQKDHTQASHHTAPHHESTSSHKGVKRFFRGVKK